MGRISGRWIGILVAVLVVGVLAVMLRGGGQPATPPVVVTDPAAQPVTQTVPGMSAGTLAGLMLKVAIVAALLGGSLWLLRRYAGSNARNRGRTGVITIVDTIAIAQGRALYVLDLGDRAAVIGATPQQLTTLAELTDPETLAKLRATPEPVIAPLADLSGKLGSFLQSMNQARAAALAERQSRRAEADERPEGGSVQVVRQPAGPSFHQTLLTRESAAAAGGGRTGERVGLGLGQTHRDATSRTLAPALSEVDVPPDNEERLRAIAERLQAAR
jgi:flagellar biosynthetic protein FliO